MVDFRTRLAFGAAALAALAMPAAAQDFGPPEGIGETEWARFVSAAAPVLMEDGETIMLYDFATRCAAMYDVAAQRFALHAGPAAARQFRLDELLNESYEDLLALRAGGDHPAGDCAARVSAAFGSAFVSEAARVGAIARHGIAVLRGAPIDGEDATSHPEDAALTEQSREAVSDLMPNPVLLATRRSGDRIVLILGEPGFPYRWMVQYQELAAGGWRYEGAHDAPYLR